MSKIACALLAALAACSRRAPGQPEPSSKGAEAPPAILAFYGDTGTVELPSSVRVGETVPVRFSTFGGGCSGPGEMDVAISGLGAEIRPYLVKPPPEQPDTVTCTADLRIDWRVAAVRFDRVGRARIRIVGYAVPEERRFVLVKELEVTS